MGRGLRGARSVFSVDVNFGVVARGVDIDIGFFDAWGHAAGWGWW